MHIILESPGAILFTAGPTVVRWYGVMISLGFLCAAYAAYRLAHKLQADSDRILNLGLICFIGGVVGARLYFCMLKWQDFAVNPMEIFATWHGGMSIHGAMIGAFVTGSIYCCIHKLSIPVCADIISTAAVLGQAIGRWGNFFNNELFGNPVPESFPIALYIPPQNRPDRFINFEYFHPAFLYESVLDLLVFCFLYFYAAPKLKATPGATFWLYLILYSICRILVESLRCDSIMYAGLQVPLVVSAVVLLVSTAVFAFIQIKHRHLQQN